MIIDGVEDLDITFRVVAWPNAWDNEYSDAISRRGRILTVRVPCQVEAGWAGRRLVDLSYGEIAEADGADSGWRVEGDGAVVGDPTRGGESRVVELSAVAEHSGPVWKSTGGPGTNRRVERGKSNRSGTGGHRRRGKGLRHEYCGREEMNEEVKGGGQMRVKGRLAPSVFGR